MSEHFLVLEYDVNINSGLRTLNSIAAIPKLTGLKDYFERKVGHLEETLKSAERVVGGQGVQSVYTESSKQGIMTPDELIDFTTQWLTFNLQKTMITYSFRIEVPEQNRFSLKEYVVVESPQVGSPEPQEVALV